ncbi:MAG: Lrp/AsnC family transcriptional regulator [Pseudomonadota bacterium]
MAEQTNSVRSKPTAGRTTDAKDRTLLGLLAEDATRSYADLGRLLHLSPPAVHERVKRLKRDGVIKATVAVLDAEKVGKPLLAFVHVDTAGWGKSEQLMAMSKLPEVEEIHTVAGDTCVLLKIRTDGPQALEDILREIYDINGVERTRSYIALSTVLERGVRPRDG